jgi:hypothetical protein
MKNLFRFLLGLNAASLVRGLRFGAGETRKSVYASLAAVYPFQDREEKETLENLAAIPVKPVTELLGGHSPEIHLLVQPHEDGMANLADATVLLAILAATKPREILEIGTFMGHTTRRMAANAEGAIIHTIDLPEDFSAGEEKNLPPKDDFHLITRRIVGREFRGLACEKQIIQHFGDSATFDFSAFGHPTFFLIDGSHTYEYCKLDSEKCLALCPKGGTFLWHDCDRWHPGVLKFIHEWRALGRDLVRVENSNFAYWKAPA